MQKILTWEIRWFESGFPPIEVKQWFYQNCPGKWLESPEDPEERQDLYLPTPGCEMISLKQRQENLELKWCQSDGGIQQFGINQVIWEGKVEKWVKWTYENLAASNCIPAEEMAENWGLTVKKKRSQRIYQGVECELAQLTVDDRHWWTIAFEMEENAAQNKEHFEQVVNRFSQTYHGSPLTAVISYGYPRWQKINHLTLDKD